MRQTDQEQGGGRLFQYKRYLTYYIDFFNIIQPAWGIEWMIAGDESNNTDILRVKRFAEHLKTA